MKVQQCQKKFVKGRWNIKTEQLLRSLKIQFYTILSVAKNFMELTNN